MGILDRLFGGGHAPRPPRASSDVFRRAEPVAASSDDEAIRRYRYMVKTAPPEAVEQAHEEAFAKLTPDQRAQVLRGLADITPERERAALANRDDPKSLARLATRAEMREPGTMERQFGRPGAGGMGMGGMLAGTIFGSMVASFVGSAIAHQFFDSMDGGGFAESGAGEQAAETPMAETMAADHSDAGADFGGDFGDF